MANGTIALTSSKAWEGEISWDATAHVDGNYSSMYVVAKMWKTDGYLTSSNSPTSGTITINGVSYELIGYREFKNSVTIFEKTLSISHNSDGKKTVSISLSCKGQPSTSLASATLAGSGNAVLDNIPRDVSLTSAPNFTDEGNPTISYSNPAGNGADSLKAAILSSSGSTVYAAYREIPKTGSSYTFNLTTAERNAIRSAMPSASSMWVKFSLIGTFGGTQLSASLSRQVTIVNGNPTISATATEQNGSVAALTGDSITLIRYISNVKTVMTAAALKYASIQAQKITCGNIVIESNSGTFVGVESGTFVFEAVDSRGNSSKVTITKNIVPYIIPTCNIAPNSPDTAGHFTFKVSGNYFNGSFGAVNNSLSVQYRYKSTGDYTPWTTMPATISGNTYTASANFSNLDYKTTYTFQARIIDKLNTVVTEEKPMRSKPVYDWGPTDFNVNGDFNIDGDTALRKDENGRMILSSDGSNGVCIRPNGALDESGEVYVDRNGNTYVKGNLIVNGVILGNSGAKVLFSGSTNGTVTLSESAANFDYLEIYFTDNNGRGGGFTKVYEPDGKQVHLALVETNGSTSFYLRHTNYSINDTLIEPISGKAGYSYYNGASWSNGNASNYIKIYRVVGYYV